MSAYKPPAMRNSETSTSSSEHRTFSKTSSSERSERSERSRPSRGGFGGNQKRATNPRGAGGRGGQRTYTNEGSSKMNKEQQYRHYNRCMKVSRSWISQGYYDWAEDWARYASNSSLPIPPNYHTSKNTDGTIRYLNNMSFDDYQKKLGRVKPFMYQGCKTTGGGCSNFQVVNETPNRELSMEQLNKKIRDLRNKCRGTVHSHIYFKPRATYNVRD